MGRCKQTEYIKGSVYACRHCKPLIGSFEYTENFDGSSKNHIQIPIKEPSPVTFGGSNMHIYDNAIEKFISNFIKVPIELLQPKVGLWVVAPKDRCMLHSKLWNELRNGPLSGVGQSPIEAVLLLVRAAGATGPRRISPRYRARFWLQDLLGDFRSLSVEKIKQKAEADHLPWSSVDRAARDLSIKRTKCGFRSGWIWQMPC